MTSGSNQPKQMRAPLVVACVAVVHAVALASFVFIQGCGTTKGSQVSVEPPPPPLMPPTDATSSGIASLPGTSLGPETIGGPITTTSAPAGGLGDTYVIQKGDSLSKVAKRYGLSTRELAEINNISNPNKIVVGQKLVLPGGSRGSTTLAKTTSSGTRKSATFSSTKPVDGANYTVQSGDVLSRIAVRNGTTVSAIKKANGLTSDNIYVGQKLLIPGVASPSSGTAASSVASSRSSSSLPSASLETDLPTAAPAPAAAIAPEAEADITSGEQPLDYTVLSGDTLDEIAKLFIVSKQDILELNGLSGDDALQPGQKILIPPPDL